MEGQHSDRVPVTSGVPQGSVLGPSLFLNYINDIPEVIGSTVRLFADDAVMYLTIASQTDSHKFQTDLNNIAKWEKRCKYNSTQINAKCLELPINETP